MIWVPATARIAVAAPSPGALPTSDHGRSLVQASANGIPNIGTSILKHFVITTDFQQRAAWLAPDRS